MHILMISDVFFPRVNGVSTSIATFRRGLCENGQHRCTLVVPRYGAGDPPDPGVHRVAARRVPMDPEDRLMSGRALERALGGIDARGVDVVHVQTPSIAHSAGVRWARRQGLPVVETWHTHFEEYFHHYVPFLPRRLLRVAPRSVSRRQCNAVDRIIVPSPAMEQVLRAHGIERPITVLPTGIDRREFAGGDRAAFRRRHGIPADRRGRGAVRGLPAPRRRAPGLLCRGRPVRVRLAHRDAGSGAARSAGAWCAGRGARGPRYARDRAAGARCLRGARRSGRICRRGVVAHARP